MKSKLTIIPAVLLAASTTAAAAELLPPPGDGIAELTISGNQATAVVAVADLEIDLTVTFEQVVGLSAAN
ncbi:MAG TPA: hypothetical protein VMT16_02715, partial [Thermoanaerobaculia bacterium]|nr:hypothetical protein [Thermoanaerobaculia bacterium]